MVRGSGREPGGKSPQGPAGAAGSAPDGEKASTTPSPDPVTPPGAEKAGMTPTPDPANPPAGEKATTALSPEPATPPGGVLTEGDGARPNQMAPDLPRTRPARGPETGTQGTRNGDAARLAGSGPTAPAPSDRPPPPPTASPAPPRWRLPPPSSPSPPAATRPTSPRRPLAAGAAGAEAGSTARRRCARAGPRGEGPGASIAENPDVNNFPGLPRARGPHPAGPSTVPAESADCVAGRPPPGPSDRPRSTSDG